MAIYITVCAVLAAGDKPPALRYTKGKVRTSSYVHTKELHFHQISHGESSCPTVPQSDDFVVTAPEVALQPVAQGDASGVGRANSRVNCFAISLAALPPPIRHGENANLELRTLKKA